MSRTVRVTLLASMMLLVSAVGFAQTGAIAGSVKDTTGALLPGVTVEAASPSLIEKVRSVVTDAQGAYKIIDLNPGTYTVTFALAGFTSIKRQGVDLTSGTTVNVSIEMRVGNIEETVLVQASTPLVDIQSANQYRALTRDQLNDLPTGRQWFDYVVLIPGVSQSTRGQDVGGNTGDQSQALAIHGSIGNEMPHLVDGMRSGNIFGTGGGTNGPYPVNNAITQEIAVDTSGPSAESEVSGIRSNIIFKQGGNRYSGFFFANGMTQAFQASNLDATLIARGATTPTIEKKMWDLNPGFGGPVIKDKMWFYAAARYYGAVEQPPGAYYAVDPYAVRFTPDLARGAAENPQHTVSQNVHVTWQVSPKNKIVAYADANQRCIPCANGLSSAVSFESTTQLKTPVNRMVQLSWVTTISDRLLLELGETYKPDSWGFSEQPGVNDKLSPIVDSVLGIQYRGPTTAQTQQTSFQQNGMAKVSYVTGSSSLKVGAQWFSGTRRRDFETPNDSYYGFTNGVPTSVTVLATPYSAWENLRLNFAAYAQEQWTKKRMTLNLGLRYDHINLYIPAQTLAAVQNVGPRSFPEIDDIPNFNDISPRIGVAYDLFGSGKTALKGSLSRYVEGLASGFPEAVNPITQNASATRSWGDTNGNFIPDCNLSNAAANGECGPDSNQNFGKPVFPFSYDPRVSTGWGNRGYNWEASVGIQHELRPGMSVDVSYFRRWYGNFRVTHNTAVAVSDYSSYCVTAPTDSRLPTSGQSICGFYDLNPTVPFGTNTNVVTTANNYGGITQHFDGLDVTANLRLPGKIQVQGGTSTGRTSLNFCNVVRPDVTPFGGTYSEWSNPYPAGTLVPAGSAFCDVHPPMQTQVKLIGMYSLPWWGVRTSVSFQSLGGPQILSIYAAPAATVTGLGRSLAGGVRTVSIPLVAAGTVYGDRLNQVDFRVAKNINVGQVLVQPQLDLYNMLNANAVYGVTAAYGPAWTRPTLIMLGRMLKFGVQLTF